MAGLATPHVAARLELVPFVGVGVGKPGVQNHHSWKVPLHHIWWFLFPLHSLLDFLGFPFMAVNTKLLCFFAKPVRKFVSMEPLTGPYHFTMIKVTPVQWWVNGKQPPFLDLDNPRLGQPENTGEKQLDQIRGLETFCLFGPLAQRAHGH